MKCFMIIAASLVAASSAGAPPPYGYTPSPAPYGYSPTPAPYHEPVGHYSPSPAPYHAEPVGPYHEPVVAPYAPYRHEPSYVPAVHHHPGPYAPPPPPHHPVAPYHEPHCAKGNPKPYCLEDKEYPTYEIEKAIEYHYDSVQQMYKDVLANTENSVARLKELVEETYLCPSETKYIQPQRAINVRGKWSIVVNHVKAHYETLTQTARVEECGTAGSACPLVPPCYETKCVQKSVYHRFLVYDPYDQYLPFAIESFKLPSACACYNGAFAEAH